MPRSLARLVGLTLVTTACALIPPSHPDLAYYPAPRDPTTVKISQTLYRAARAAGDDPDYYSFALIQTTVVTSFAADDATFYVSDRLERLPQRHVDALVAQKVAHEILGHTGKRRTLSMAITAGFAVLGIFMPGFGLADFVVNPLIVRAYSREQELAADQRTLEILRDMGHAAPARGPSPRTTRTVPRWPSRPRARRCGRLRTSGPAPFTSPRPPRPISTKPTRPPSTRRSRSMRRPPPSTCWARCARAPGRCGRRSTPAGRRSPRSPIFAPACPAAETSAREATAR